MSVHHRSDPLPSLERWDEFVEGRYRPGKSQAEFRQYDANADPKVAAFYRLNHQNQTVEYVLRKEEQYFGLKRGQRTVWEMADHLDTLVDDSDPDTDLSQLEHLLQTAEAIRADGNPRWMVLAGFLHDLGKCLCLYGEPQWGVVGDTFPVGCAWSDQVVFPKYFAENPDARAPHYQTRWGIYDPNCGLENVHMSFGHDGYIAEVVKKYLPDEALYMLRFHSFYAWHRHGAYEHLQNKKDKLMLPWVQKFSSYDLYSKGHTKPNRAELKPFYDDLFAEFLPNRLDW